MSRYTKVVLASVILVVVAITVSVSVVYWMGGIAPLWVVIEGIEISTVSVARGAFSGNYSIIVSVKNTGNVNALIDMIYINGMQYDNKSFTDKIYIRESADSWVSFGQLNILVDSGNSKLVLLRIKPASRSATVAPFIYGAMLDVEVRTASGRAYPQTVILPVLD